MVNRVRIEQSGLDDVIRGLVVLSSPIDLAEVSTAIFLLAQADVDERFRRSPRVRSGGPVPGGVIWPRLTDPYLSANPRREGGQILRDEGELANSFQIGDSANITLESANELVFGTSLPKARGLQVDRPILFISDDLADGSLNVLADYIARSA